MNSKAVISTIMVLSLVGGECAFAQGDSNQTYQYGNGQGQRSDQQNHRNNDARQPNRGQHPGQGNNNFRHDQRGAGPDHSYYAGGRLPNQYRSRQYVVNDWRGHNLSAPPRGYHWVQTGSDYVLVAIATGVILQLLLNN
jgi:Ni/Co efflux regulator RcnB